MSLNSKRERYPYSRNRAILSAIIAILSTVLALTLLLSDTILMLYYFFATFILTTITFFMKKRLYSLLMITTEDRQVETEDEMKGASWKMLLVAFFMLIGSIAIPLFLAALVSGPIWFIMITSFLTGVSVSEVILYLQARSNR